MKTKFLKKIFVLLIIFMFIIPLTQINEIPVTNLSLTKNSNRVSVYNAVQPSFNNTIYINGNSTLLSYASSHGWSGNGSISNPILIQNLNFHMNNTDAIEIVNTNLYFVIQKCNFTTTPTSAYYGIVLWNVTNALVTSNIMIAGSGSGGAEITLIDSANNTIMNNSISNGDTGFLLNNSPTYVFNNTITNFSNYGILDSSANDARIINNTISTSNTGIYLQTCHNTLVQGNWINFSSTGISLYIGTSNATVEENNIINSTVYGLFLYSTVNNTINWNNFINNTANPAQATSLSVDSSNNLNYNYWSNINITDANNDNFNDYPVNINGNYDEFPLTMPFENYYGIMNNIPKLQSYPVFINPPTSAIVLNYPSNGNSIMKLSWTKPFTNFNGVITYDLFLRDNNNNSNSVLLTSGLTTTEYTWNFTNLISVYSQNFNYTLLLIAQSSYTNTTANFLIYERNTNPSTSTNTSSSKSTITKSLPSFELMSVLLLLSLMVMKKRYFKKNR